MDSFIGLSIDKYQQHLMDGSMVPLGPCSYNSTFAMENEVPICGNDVGLF